MLTTLCLCGTLRAAPVVLVDHSNAHASIVLPDEASPTVRRAAAELCDYLGKISGVRLPIVAETEAEGVRIDVGPTRLTRTRMPAPATNDDERVWIETHDHGVSICGGGDRGTLFGVFRFLETLGCRWLTAEDEVVPPRERIEVDGLRIDTHPAFTWRLFASQPPQGERWGLKLGMNGFHPPSAAASNGACLFWPRRVQGVHAYHQIVPAGKYFATHPEWSPLQGGKRMPTELFRQLCVTAPGLVETFSANVIAALEDDPPAPAISISPNDGYRWCECDACLALDRRLCGGRTTRQGLDRDRPFLGDRVFWFANEVAQRVGAKMPDRKLLMLAYVNFAEPPDAIRPASNIVPFLCHYAPADYSRPIADPSSPANRDFDALLHRWLAISPDLMLYSYVSKSMWWRLPRPVLHAFAADVKHLHRLGVRRYYCQSTLADWPLDGPLYYVLAKLLWDPAADPDVLAREWTDAMFGPAAPEMAAFYASVESAVKRTGKAYSDNPRAQVPGLYDRPSLDVAMAALERAEKAAAADPLVARRVDEVVRTFRYGYWMIEWLEQVAALEATGDATRIDAVDAAGRRALGYCRVPEAVEEVEKRFRNLARLGVLNRGFGTGETRGGRPCWNADDTGPGDQASGWAEFFVPVADTSRPVSIELDVWGESVLSNIVILTAPGQWTKLSPERPLERVATWQTLRFRVPPDAFARDQKTQHFGLGGGDDPAWLAAVRWQQEEPERAAAP